MWLRKCIWQTTLQLFRVLPSISEDLHRAKSSEQWLGLWVVWPHKQEFCPHTHRVGEEWESGMEAQRIATCVKKVCSPQHSGHHPCGVLVIREQQHLSAGLSLKAAIYLLAPPSRFLALFRIQRSVLYCKETSRARYDRNPGLVLLSRLDSPTVRTDELPQTTFSLVTWERSPNLRFQKA